MLRAIFVGLFVLGIYFAFNKENASAPAPVLTRDHIDRAAREACEDATRTNMLNEISKVTPQSVNIDVEKHTFSVEAQYTGYGYDFTTRLRTGPFTYPVSCDGRWEAAPPDSYGGTDFRFILYFTPPNGRRGSDSEEHAYRLDQYNAVHSWPWSHG
jgi:hypothetical protein